MIQTSICLFGIRLFGIRLFGIRYLVFAFAGIRSIRYSSFFTIRRPLLSIARLAPLKQKIVPN